MSAGGSRVTTRHRLQARDHRARGVFDAGIARVPFVVGVDRYLPVDVAIPGCPPRPEALTEGLLRIQDIMMCERWKTKMRPGRVDPNAPMMIPAKAPK